MRSAGTAGALPLHTNPPSSTLPPTFERRKRAWKTNLLLIAQAALFIVLTWGVDKAMRASNQRRPAFSSVPTALPQPIRQIPDCADNMFMRHEEPCYTLLYAPQASFM